MLMDSRRTGVRESFRGRSSKLLKFVASVRRRSISSNYLRVTFTEQVE
jgi:hypothetical protein